MRRRRGLAGLCLLVFLGGCSGALTASQPFPHTEELRRDTLWIAPVRNSTHASLRLPAANPLRSLAEMARKVGPDYRPTVMDLLREELKIKLEGRAVKIAFPERSDSRLGAFPFDAAGAAGAARKANLSGFLLLTDIRRWDSDPHAPLRSRVEFRLVRIDDGTIAWQHRVQKITSSTAAPIDQLSAEAVKEIVRQSFDS